MHDSRSLHRPEKPRRHSPQRFQRRTGQTSGSPRAHRTRQNRARADATNFESMAQVANEKFILPTKTDGEIYHNLQWSICEDAGFSPQISHETVHGYTTLKLVENNLGISLIPISFERVTNAAIKFIELRDIPQKAEITALWNLENPNPSLRRFLELV